MKTMNSLSFLSLALPLALGACVDQNGFSPEDLTDDGLGEAGEAVRITVLDYDDNGVQTTQVVAMEADEFEALTSARPGAPARQGAADDEEGVGTAAQALTVQSNAAGCVSRGLLIYSAANRQGEVLCLMTVGHEGGGSARFTLPLDWRLYVGTKYPASYWAGEDAGQFEPTNGGTPPSVFSPWAIVNSGDYSTITAYSVRMDRLLTAPTAPSIAVPSNYPLVHRMAAKGHQIYVCDGASWVLSAPSAVLSDPHAPFDVLGHHFAGPQWRGIDGSTIRGRKIGEVASPDPNAIPWLTLDITERSGSGVFAPIAYIQRVNTVGGKAPATTCSAAAKNQLVWVDYSADYYFYAFPTAPAAWTCSAGYYNTSDGCDCNCGVPDPDCVKQAQYVYGCAAECTMSGVCAP